MKVNSLIILSFIVLFLNSCSKNSSIAEELDGNWLLTESYRDGFLLPPTPDSIDGVFLENAENFKGYVSFNYYNKGSRLEMIYLTSVININDANTNLIVRDTYSENIIGNVNVVDKGTRLKIQNSQPEKYINFNLQGNYLEIFYNNTSSDKDVFLKE